MKNSGCVCIGFGIESGSQKILDNMNKRLKVEEIEESLRLCKELGIPVKVQLIYGYPGENEQSLNETLELFRKIRYPARRLGIITPLPGSPLYEIAKKDGFIGDGKNDVITEKKYHEFLSFNGGWCNKKIFYNRTEFSDKLFPIKFKKTNMKLITNFVKEIIRHPIDIIRYWNVYQFYIRNWWYHRGTIPILKFTTVYPIEVFKNPRRVFEKVIELLYGKNANK
jgi:radical SAM superfamily enzyme YgiQ (UPF0313 family)